MFGAELLIRVTPTVARWRQRVSRQGTDDNGA